MVGNPGPLARVRHLEAENKRLHAEHTEGARHIAELRKIVADFEQQLNEAKAEFQQVSELRCALAQAQEEAARYEREAGILTRALAVHAVEADIDGEAALVRASAQWDIEQVSAELARLREVEIACERTQNENEYLRKKTGEFDAIQLALLRERTHHDQLVHECEKLSTRAEIHLEERNRLAEQAQELEARLRVATMGRSEEEQKNAGLAKRVETLTGEVGEMKNKESLMYSNLSQLESKVVALVDKERKIDRENEILKSENFALQEELKRMHASLHAETDASVSLSLRVEKIEADREKLAADVEKLKSRNEQLETSLADLQQVQLDNETLRREIFDLRNLCEEKDEKIAQLVAARDVQKKCLGAEIQRLAAQLDAVTQKGNELAQKYSRMTKEKDKIKSLLAKDTLSRLSRVLANPNESRWSSVNSFSYN